MIQTKEQDKTPLAELNERKISDIPKKRVQIKTFTTVRKTSYEQSENLNNTIENIWEVPNRNHRAEHITEMKISIESSTSDLIRHKKERENSKKME